MTDQVPEAHEYAKLELSLTNITPTAEQIERIEALREVAKLYAQALVESSAPSREKSLAKTHLEDSVMWAVKSILINETTFGTFDNAKWDNATWGARDSEAE